jgi:phenylalanyl-tRNA synthetase beta chain
LGDSIPILKVKQILSRLGFIVKTRGKYALMVNVPGFRQDIKTQIDLVEEVARIYGYDKIPLSLPRVMPQKAIAGNREIISEIKSILRSLGSQEAVTYSLVDRSLLGKSGIKIDAQPVEILNPLSKEQEVLRSSLLPSLIRALAYNLNQQQEYINIFEIADIFFAKSDSPGEEISLGIALCGAKPFFVKQGLVKEEVNILHLKGILESLFNKFGIKDYDFKPGQGDQINIIIGGQVVGLILGLNVGGLSSLDIKNKQVVLAELNLLRLLRYINTEKKFKGIPKYPAITRDISFIINEEVSVKDLLGLIMASGAPLLSLAKVVDYYQGKQIPPGFRGLTISCIYRASDRTLTEDEIAPLHNSICSLLEERFGIKLR